MKTKNLVLMMLSIAVFLFISIGWNSASANSTSSQTQGSILYVKPGGVGGCSSWGDACDLQTAIFNATTGDQIWVAAGTYKPTASSNREATFQLKSGVAIYGGFPAAGGTWEQRNWQTNLTTLSGEIGVETTIGDNSYHVVTGSGVDAAAILDGFTIVAGNANGSSPHNCGGGMYNTSGAATLSNLTFSANSAAFGGGICNHENSNLTLEDVVFSSNIASDSGAGIYNTNSNPTLTNVDFSNNMATVNGGGIFNLNSNGSLSGVSFTDNKAEGTNHSTGGGMFNSGSNPILFDVTFTGNSAYLFGIDGGGGMFNFESNPTLTNVTFSENTASRGGGMSNKESSPILTEVTFSENSAYIEGGGMNNMNHSNPTLNSVNFTSNTVYGYTTSSGGGMYNNTSNPVLTDVIFESNSASMGSGSYGDGGGLFNNNSNPTITETEFVINSAARGGGMFNLNSNPLLSDVVFYGNSATGTAFDYGGGGMYISGGSPSLRNILFNNNDGSRRGGAVYIHNGSPIFNTVEISENSCTNDGVGGGIFIGGGSPFLADVSILDNTAGYGAGIYIGSSTPTLMNVTFDSNIAHVHGGGIFNSSGSPTLTNVTLSGNTAAFGGGMFNDSNSVNTSLINVTFVENSASFSGAYGGGILDYGEGTTLTNAILWGNTPDQVPFNSVTMTYSLIQGGYAGEGNISTPPLLSALANNGGFVATHALMTGSPAIDSGSPSVCPIVDARAYIRPIDGDGVNGPRCDMGAYEYDSSVAAFSLTVDTLGGGTVTKNPDKPSYSWGEEVILTASDGPDWIFDGWGGDASGMDNPLRVTINKNTHITASFWLDAWTITTSVVPADSGNVSLSPDQPTYHYGDEVTLSATPNPGYSFLSWTGDASGTQNPLTVTIDGNLVINANFTRDEYSLAVSVTPEGKGSVTISPSKPFYYYGDQVTLTATAISGWWFTNWSGDVSGVSNPLILSITGNTHISANFSDQVKIYLPLITR